MQNSNINIKNYDKFVESGFMKRKVQNNGNFTFLLSVHIFSFIVCGEQQTFIYK